MFKWDAVDTSPDFGGQNVLETFDIKGLADDVNGIRDFLSLDLFSLTFKNVFGSLRGWLLPPPPPPMDPSLSRSALEGWST